MCVRKRFYLYFPAVFGQSNLIYVRVHRDGH